jgi:transposase
LRTWRRTGGYAPGQIGGQNKRRLASRKDWLQQVMIRTPDITLAELQTDLAQQGINTTLRAWEYRHKTLRARTGSPRSRGAASPTA